MANREDIRDRIRRINPLALELMDERDRRLLKSGFRGAMVNTTSDMTLQKNLRWHYLKVF